jgi:hypothetical protein
MRNEAKTIVKRILHGTKIVLMSPLIIVMSGLMIIVFEVVSSGINQANTEAALDSSRHNHCLVEGAQYKWYDNTEEEIIHRALRSASRLRVHKPADKDGYHTFTDDFLDSLDDSFEHKRELFNQ